MLETIRMHPIQRPDLRLDIPAETLRREPVREQKGVLLQYISDLGRYIRLQNGASPQFYQRLCNRLPWSSCFLHFERKIGLMGQTDNVSTSFTRKVFQRNAFEPSRGWIKNKKYPRWKNLQP